MVFSKPAKGSTFFCFYDFIVKGGGEKKKVNTICYTATRKGRDHILFAMQLHCLLVHPAVQLKLRNGQLSHRK